MSSLSRFLESEGLKAPLATRGSVAAQEANFQKDVSAIELMPLFSICIAFNREIGRR
jgi:hypothetical protein